MQINYSQEIRLLLNELAILSQPTQIDGKLIYEKDTLKKLKSVSARLFILCEFTLSGNSDLQLMFQELEQRLGQANNQNTNSIKLDSVEELPVTPVAEQPPVAIPEPPVIIPEPVIIQPEPVMVPEIPKIEPLTPPPAKVEETAPVIENIPDMASLDKILSKINISRRFEYVNFLFAGNMDGLKSFLAVAVAAGSKMKALEIWDTYYNDKNWSKKAETAEDLKKIIKNYYDED